MPKYQTSQHKLEDHFPSPADIRRGCEMIRASWTPKEKAKRAGLPRRNYWTPQEISIEDIFYIHNNDDYRDGLGSISDQ
jgi:hypothetical protein